jgi:tight adherence protein B
MISSSFIAGLSSALLIAGGGLLILGGRDGERRLRERILATRDQKAETAGPGRDFFIDVPQNGNLFVRSAEFLGYRSDLPPPYSISLKIVGVAAIAVAAVVFRLLRALLPVYFAAPVAVFAALVVASLLFHRKSVAYRAVLFRQIPDAMSLMLRAVRAGLPVAEAIRSVARESMSPTREEFNRVAGEAALGMPIDVTLHRLYRRTLIQEYAFFSVVIGLHGQTGGNLSETLENLADMVRRRVAMAGKARALAAEGRLSALVVGVLPFVVGVLISFINPDYVGEFVSNPKGPLLVVAFAVLLTLGAFSSHLLIQRSTQD